jgi:hypothetical protein
MQNKIIPKMESKILPIAGFVFLTSCLQESGPNAPACDNRVAQATACSDCESTNPEHRACYDTFTHAVYPIFKSRCIGCHTSGGMGEFSTGGDETGLNFDKDVAYNRMMMPSFGDSGKTQRIVPGIPDSSSLFNKINSNKNAPWFGSPMPEGYALVNGDPKAVETIRQWILDGAKAPMTALTPILSKR